MSSSRPSSTSRTSKCLEQDVQQIEELDAECRDREARRKLERQLLRKLDWRMSILLVIYVLNYIDRSNIAVARLRGFERDLHLHGEQFATLLSTLFIGHTIMQIPSNMFLNYIGKPSKYLTGCMIMWGTLAILTGVTHNFVGALVTRFFLGFVEAAFFPGALFLLTKWYKRHELGLRVAILYSGLIVSTAFGSVMASGILDGMNGKLGLAAWRWLFYIEGSLTITVAVCAMFILPDFPSTTRWLSDEERILAMKRMEEDAGVGDERETELESNWATGLKLAVTDWRVWWMAFACLCQMTALSFNTYFPTLCATMGFNPTVTLLLCAPPFIFAGIVAIIVSKHSDKTGERFCHICIPLVGGVVGFIIAMSTMNTAARYFSMFLMAQSYAGYVVCYPWIINAFPRPPSKRAVVLALVNMFSQLGNVAGSYVWQSKWGPTYRTSYGICLATSSCMIVMCFLFRQHLAHLNRQLDKEEEEKGVQGMSFRYML